MAGTTALISEYGALELKRAYRKNLTTGVMVACLFVLLLAIAAIFVNGTEEITVEPIDAFWDGKIDIGRPPNFVFPEKRVITTQPKPPSTGRLVAVADTLIGDQCDIPTNSELEQYILSQKVIDLNGINTDSINFTLPEGHLPADTDFVFYEEPPLIVESMMPKYPEIARRAGIEGIVWVSVLLDKSGNVRDVRISRDSGQNAGFEEAAIEAARQTVWKPAISNGQPVALWVSYKIVFTLKNGN